MASNRKRRANVQHLQCSVSILRRAGALQDSLWERMAPVGREFGSPDFERLMEEDQRCGAGVFDPAVGLHIAEPANGDALLAFCDIARRWGLSPDEQAMLLGIDRAEVDRLEGALTSFALSDETRSRLKSVLEISDALEVLLPIPERADAWVRQPNAIPMFGGATALSYMLRGQLSDLRNVARYLVAQCSGDFS